MGSAGCGAVRDDLGAGGVMGSLLTAAAFLLFFTAHVLFFVPLAEEMKKRRKAAADDREVISWVATTAGISGEMIRDMMVHCVEQRFGDMPGPHGEQWLTWPKPS